MSAPGSEARPPARAIRRRVLRTVGEALGAVIVMTAAYFLVPLPSPREVPPWVVVGTFALGLLGISVLMTWRVIAYRQRDASGSARLRGLVVALCAAVLYFALTYAALAGSDPQQFADLGTRVDALYFSVTAITTVGFGDVHPIGQAARAVVTVHMVFNLAFLGLAASAIRSRPPFEAPAE